MIKTNLTDKRPRRDKFSRKIKLISGGMANQTAFPGGEITVLPWDSSVDHWLIETSTSATGPARDRILYDLMGKLCVLGPCPLEEFVLGDVNTVLLVARSISEMNRIKYLTTCPACGHEEVDQITVPDELKPVGQKAIDYKGYDSVTLRESQDVVDIRPLRIKDTLSIVGRSPQSKAEVSDHLAHILAPIVNVGGSPPDRIQELLEWYNALHPADAAQIETFTDSITPHLSQELAQQCASCRHVYPHRLVLDQEFFRTGRMGTAGRALAADL